MKTIKSLFFALVVLLMAPSAFAQTTINTTTLSTAITDTNATTTIALASIGSGSTAVLAGHVLFMDGEAMQVNTTPTAAGQVSVTRHTNATRGQTHGANVIVLYGPKVAFVSGTPGVQFYQGTCTASNNQYLPIIDTVNATIGYCDTRWTWTKLNAQYGVSVPYHAVADAAYTVKFTDYIIGYTSLSAARTVTLPAATGLYGKVYIVRNESTIASNTIWISSASNIDTVASGKGIFGTSTAAASGTNGGLAAVGVIRLYSNGSAWFTF